MAKLKPKDAKSGAKDLKLRAEPGEVDAESRARAVLRPSVQACLTILDYSKGFGELSIDSLCAELGEQAKHVHQGDLRRLEGTLMNQAQTLDAIFNNLARRAAVNAGEFMGACETYLRLALKAQAQCRATLETLAEIKNPRPVSFVRQANIAHGPQQVNNGVQEGGALHAPARTENSANQSNELLEASNGERLDTGTASAASGAYSQLETVGVLHRPQD